MTSCRDIGGLSYLASRVSVEEQPYSCSQIIES